MVGNQHSSLRVGSRTRARDWGENPMLVIARGPSKSKAPKRSSSRLVAGARVAGSKSAPIRALRVMLRPRHLGVPLVSVGRIASLMNGRSCRSAKTSEEPRGPLRSGNGALAFALGHTRPRRGQRHRPRSVLGQTPTSENCLKCGVLEEVSQQEAVEWLPTKQSRDSPTRVPRVAVLRRQVVSTETI